MITPDNFPPISRYTIPMKIRQFSEMEGVRIECQGIGSENEASLFQMPIPSRAGTYAGQSLSIVQTEQLSDV